MHRRVVRPVLLSLAVAGLAPLAARADGSARSHPSVPALVAGVPGAAQVKPPATWAVGTRFVFLSTNGVTQSDPGKMGMRRDPNGSIKDDQGGTWTATSFTGGTSGGVGYTVIDVVATDGTTLVLDQRNHLLAQGVGGPSTYVGGGAWRIAAAGFDFFLHPTLLAGVKAEAADGRVVFRGPVEHDGRVRAALRATTSTAGYASNVYDLESGILLTSASAVRVAQGTILGDDRTFKPASAASTATHRFVGRRALALPWAGGAAPAWVRSAKRLVYRGVATSASPGLPPTQVGLTTVFTTTQSGAGWAIYDVSSAYDQSPGIPVIPATSTFASGLASTTGLFIDPAVLAKLVRGAVLDRDPTLGTETTVEHVGPAPDGRPAVSILVAAPIQRIQSVYDVADGRLRRQIVTERTPGTSITNVRDLGLVSVD